MLVKTFKAADMPEALRMVKTEFGPDAMIISSRKHQRKGFLWRTSKPLYEVTAALDRLPGGITDSLPDKAQGESSTLDEFRKSMLVPLARELKELRARVETISSRETDGARRQSPPVRDICKPDRVMPADVPAPFMLPTSEVEDLKQVLLSSMTESGEAGMDCPVIRQEVPSAGIGSEAVAALAGELSESGVGEEAIALLLTPLTVDAARGETLATLRERLKASIEAGIACSGPFKVKRNMSRILAMVGPTGVGKTTTIAKLAALAYKQGVTVALITIDTFRIGAVQQLQTYSGIMGMPMAIASTPAELAEAIADHADKQLIFIDTAGRSPRDREKLLEMKSFLDVNPSIEVHLCLAATTRDKELERTVARFGVLPVSRLLFTKLDESESFGCIANTHLRNRVPLSYFTTGQRVPEDIEVATPRKVADLIIREIRP
jgi:flagellar biosynthesis protein FlhF